MGKNFISTTKCSAVQHPEFIVEFDSAVPPIDINMFISFLEESVKEGIRYKDGEHIALGSMLLRIKRSEKNLAIEEPDLKSLPIEWKQGVTRSIQLLRLQKDVAASVGLENEIDHPSIRISLLVGTDLSQCDEDLVLDRIKPVDLDSGWFVGRRDSVLDYCNEANLIRISVYEAILNWPKIGGFLALPAGCRIELSKTTPYFARNGNALRIKSGSVLDVMSQTWHVD